MLSRFALIAALALAVIHPSETFAKGGAVTLKICDFDTCKRHASLKKEPKLMPIAVSSWMGWTSQEK